MSRTLLGEGWGEGDSNRTLLSLRTLLCGAGILVSRQSFADKYPFFRPAAKSSLSLWDKPAGRGATRRAGRPGVGCPGLASEAGQRNGAKPLLASSLRLALRAMLRTFLFVSGGRVHA
jgi:hypothetical protein